MSTFFSNLSKNKWFFLCLGIFMSGVFFSSLPALKSSFILGLAEQKKVAIKEKKVALVLGSGGVRGLAHLGVLEELEKHGIPISHIIGSSSGSLVGALYASLKNITKLKEILLPLKLSDLVDIDFFGLRYGLSSGSSLKIFLEKNLPVKSFNELLIPLKVAVTDLVGGEGHIISSGRLIPAIMGSSAYPMIYRPVNWEGKTWVDGGVVNPIPVNEAQKLKPDLIIAVNTSITLKKELPSNLFGVAKRSMEISHYAKAKESLQSADIVIHPKLGEIGTFEEANNMQIYLEGKKAASLKIKSILSLLKKQKEIKVDEKPYLWLVHLIKYFKKIFFSF